ncbi:MAG: diguanylate cyclase [Anaerolineales bacterium]|nr:diguanylate cyclase [Anaerolineales bacterium]
MDALTPPQFHRADLLTGCGNLLGFLEWLTGPQGPGARAACSLVALDVNQFAHLNDARGHEQGDAALRWVGIILAEESPAPAFRTGGDEFVLVLAGGDFADHFVQAGRLFARLNREAARVGLSQPALTTAVIHYPPSAAHSPAEVLGHLESAILNVKRRADRPLTAFYAAQLRMPADARRIVDHLVERIVGLGAALDEARHLALSDPLTGLPNVRAALQRLEAAVAQAAALGRPAAVLLIDGDNLKQYNELGGYAAGDDLIRNLGVTLGRQLRPGDFLARWRVGDEFLVLLPETGPDVAAAVGERLARSVREASRDWLCPVSVSIGVAAYPAHGADLADLLAAVEAAASQAKTQGKDRVIPAGA